MKKQKVIFIDKLGIKAGEIDINEDEVIFKEDIDNLLFDFIKDLENRPDIPKFTIDSLEGFKE